MCQSNDRALLRFGFFRRTEPHKYHSNPSGHSVLVPVVRAGRNDNPDYKLAYEHASITRERQGFAANFVE